MTNLSPREQAVLELLRSCSGGVMPSVREIAARLGIKSTSTVHRYLSHLQELGLIQRGAGRNRCIHLPGETAAQVPILGTVAAGQPLLAVEALEGYLPFPLRGSPEGVFALRVRGESMVNAGILDGDYVIARQCQTADNGQIVVALIDEEATVKRFYKENGRYRLQPENDRMEPIYTDHVSILGRVIGLQRTYG